MATPLTTTDTSQLTTQPQRGHRWIGAGALLCGLAVALGAFATHGLSSVVSASRLAVFETGAQYQFWHGCALMLMGILSSRPDVPSVKIPAILFLLGCLFFCGSLYLLVLLDLPILGAITPIGGVMWLTGWAMIAFKFLK